MILADSLRPLCRRRSQAVAACRFIAAIVLIATFDNAQAKERFRPELNAECLVAAGEQLVLAVEAKRPLPGSALRVSFLKSGPYGAGSPMPRRCLRNLKLSGDDVARLSRDGHRVAIAKNAAAGARFTVSADAVGETISTTVVVDDPAIAVIEFRRAQRSTHGCGGQLIGELSLSWRRRFTVTFQPFESYVDYWGTYEYNPVTERLIMTLEGGNSIPDFLDLEGAAALDEDGAWRLDGFSLGGAMEGPSCTYLF